MLLLGGAYGIALVAAQPSWAWPQSSGSTTYSSTAPVILNTVSNLSAGVELTRPVAYGLTAGCALGRTVPLSLAAWTDEHFPHPTLAAVAVAPWAALPAGAPALSGIRQRLAVADAAAAALKRTRATLQRGLAAAATAIVCARALIAPKTRQLASAAAEALGHAWPEPKVYPLHATAKLLVSAAATAGDAAAWARPAVQAAADHCCERALLAALRGRRQAMHAAGGLPPPAGLLCSGMARCVLLHAVCSCC